MRLDKFVSAATGLSRKEATRVIRAGEIELNGTMVKKAATEATSESDVCWLGQKLHIIGLRYLMFHKPAGYICAKTDALHPTVFELISEPKQQDLHTVGRLDMDTTGLLFITDDGQWSHRVTSPSKACAKVYRAQLADPLAPGTAEAFRRGIMLKADDKPTRPAELTLIKPQDVRITITEGRYHQVKRMFAAAGNRVVALHREQVGNIRLDDDLAEGEYRSLTAAEVAQF